MISSPSRQAAGGDQAAGPERVQQPSLAFERLLGRLAAGDRPMILDLGPAIGRNVSFLASRSSKLYIADLHQTLAGGPAPRGAAFDRLLEHDLPATGGRKMALVLLWDLLDYLQPEEIDTLGRRLEPYCDASTLLYAMISIHKDQPAAPRRFEILDESTLAYERRPGARRPTPRYKEPELQRRLPAFRVERSFLLRNGMQEYLLTGSPDAVRPDR